MVLLEAAIAAPDNWFWYTLSTVLAVFLSGIIWRYIAKNDKLLEKITEILQEHETRITVMESNGNGKHKK